jgi:uncharacterized protein
MLTFLIIVTFLSLIQSLFGVGLLLFGTPILLMLGTPFRDSLWVLLPASLTISLLQIVMDRGINLRDGQRFFVGAVPALLLGLACVLWGGIKIQIDLAVACLLIVGTYLRVSDRARTHLTRFFAAHEGIALATIGLVHGITNMGGSLLSIYAGTRYEDKTIVRQHIALGYAIFAASQLVLLYLSYPGGLSISAIAYAMTAATVFVFMGRAAFGHLTQRRYNALFSVFMIACAAMLVAKRWLLA